MDKDQDKRENIEEGQGLDQNEKGGQEQTQPTIDDETKDNVSSDQDPLDKTSNNKDQPKEDNQKDVTKEEEENNQDKEKEENTDNLVSEDKSEEIKEKKEEEAEAETKETENKATNNKQEDVSISDNKKDNPEIDKDKEPSKKEKDQDTTTKDTNKEKKEEDLDSDSDDEELWDTDSSLDDLDLDIFEEEDQTDEDQDSQNIEQQDTHDTKDDNKKNDINNDTEAKEDKEKLDESSGNKLLKKLPPLKSLILWGIIGLESLLIIIGFFTIYGLTSPYLKNSSKPLNTTKKIKNLPGTKETSKHSSRSKNANSLRYPFDKNQVKLPSSAKVLGTAIISLQPFYIPIVYEGDIVFLKLHVQLTVSDPSTKAVLEHRLSLIRNIIYENLKGIVINSDERGNFLLKYCKPLQQALNKQLAPYKVTDVNLMGFILR